MSKFKNIKFKTLINIIFRKKNFNYSNNLFCYKSCKQKVILFIRSILDKTNKISIK